MGKSKSQFICQECRYSAPKWLGRCPECNAWNSFQEEVIASESTRGVVNASAVQGKTSLLSDENETSTPSTISLPMPELSRVLGGGLVSGSVTLLGGDPGIGKSTLLLQLLGQLKPQSNSEPPLLYVSGEESQHQIRLRAKRLGVDNSRIHILAETDLSKILATLEQLRPQICIIDSVQTIYWPDLVSIPGSVSQVREIADRLVRTAKTLNISTFLVGHVTKEGNIAGPKTLEHLVDTVLYFEGERGQQFRVLRSYKNRFGATDEIAVFQMVEEGLEEVSNPSELLIQDRPRDTPGSVIFPLIEGSRPLLVEIQGLATKSYYGMPIRNSVGFDKNRLTMLLAVLEKRAGVDIANQDVYVNVVGGLKIAEPSVDLAVMASVVSSLQGKSIPEGAVVFGEVGLAGEIRKASQVESRIKEAAKLGFKQAFTSLGGQSTHTNFRVRGSKTIRDFMKDCFY